MAIRETIAVDVGGAGVVIQHRELAVVAEITQQVTGQRMSEAVRHHDAADLDLASIDPQHQCRFRTRWYSGRDNRRDRNAAHIHVPFVILRIRR